MKDPTIYYGFGASGEQAEFDGRAGMGGWIERPLPASDEDGLGIVMQPAEADGEENNYGPALGAGTLPGGTFWSDAMRAAGSTTAEGGWN